MKNIEKQIYSLCSSDEEESIDYIPLKKLKPQIETRTNGNEDPSIEKCEFCDRTFDNRYALMIHNARHIIIPLLNQKFHQCQDCLYHFSSLDELKDHISRNHVLKIKNESFDDSGNQPLIKVKDDIKEKLPKDHGTIIIDDNEFDKTKNQEKENNKISKRLFFEDEDEEDDINLNSNGVLDNFVVDCKVNLEVFEAPWLFPKDDGGVKNDGVKNDELKLERFESIHFNELTVPQTVSCRCGLLFPNRYELIQHEPAHMRMKQLRHYLCFICERFISGEIQGLRNHKIRKHNGFVPQPAIMRYCDKCHLRYNSYPKHVNNYHKIYVCQYCGERFESEPERESHIPVHLEEAQCTTCSYSSTAFKIEEHKKRCLGRTSTVKVCEVCSMFFKDNQSIQYVYKEDFSEIGARHPCEKCGNKYFELKVLERVRKHRFVVHLEPEKERKPTKILSNKERLINIRKR